MSRMSIQDLAFADPTFVPILCQIGDDVTEEEVRVFRDLFKEYTYIPEVLEQARNSLACPISEGVDGHAWREFSEKLFYFDEAVATTAYSFKNREVVMDKAKLADVVKFFHQAVNDVQDAANGYMQLLSQQCPRGWDYDQSGNNLKMHLDLQDVRNMFNAIDAAIDHYEATGEFLPAEPLFPATPEDLEDYQAAEFDWIEDDLADVTTIDEIDALADCDA
eukprot:tig00000178_g12822.t1